MMRNTAARLRGDRAIAATISWVLLGSLAAWASSGTLVLTNNTKLTEDHHGNILINASHIELDCAGFTVFGPGEAGFSGGIELAGNLTGVTVKHCSVTGFAVNGIFAGGGGLDSRFDANVLYRNGNHGMHLDTGTGYIVLGNESRANGGIGIVLTGGAQSLIVRNTVRDNQNWAGIALFNGSHDNIVVGNSAVRNSIGYVLDGATGNELCDNHASLNAAQGFLLIRGANNNVLALNSANQNLIGFEITAGSNSNQVRGNESNKNTSNGFKVYQSDGNTLTENVGNANEDIGFIVFGASSFTTVIGNTGLHNGSFDALDDDLGTGNVWEDNRFGKKSGI